ncbi:class I SAM-dependent methyltransferase [Vibrio maerlii]|uniref:class I SAM-dependent methyltransferase n=1 Tax=Vibrio maerlii TaxID=2231648 RepID=UPI000E3B7A4B|nr:class I SAM-dependent methyltransferase [Vibrio maerlii]
MKVRDSGMPEESYWASFFDTNKAITRLLPESNLVGDWFEIGCGYGTFSLPAASRIQGHLHSFDIEPEMVKNLTHNIKQQGLTNVTAVSRDVISEGTGFAPSSKQGVMIYNLLHLEYPVALLKEAYRCLEDGGCLSVIHWRSDIPTPRGPSLDIRPTPKQSIEWMKQAGFSKIEPVSIEESCPYHYGILAWK